MTNAVKDFLIRAKAQIDTPEKWHKGHFSWKKDDGTVCYCAVGALYATEGSGIVGQLAGEVLENALDGVAKGAYWSVPRFNDDPATTHADVMALFDRAIASVDE